MSMSTSILMQSSTGLHFKPDVRSKALLLNPISDVSFSRNKINPTRVACNISLTGFGSSLGVLQKGSTAKRNFVVYSSVEPGNPLPSGGSWKSWVVGFVISCILPFFTTKLGPLGLLKNKFDTALQSVENVVETIEKVAEGVEKVAENLIEDLPDGKLKNAVTFVEHIAERAAKDADKIDDFIDEFQEKEEKIEDCIESIVEKTEESTKEEDEDDQKSTKEEAKDDQK